MKRTYGQLYYSVNDSRFPVQWLSIITRLKLFLATELFVNDTTENALNRFIVADVVNAQSESALRNAPESYSLINYDFPFIAYAYDFMEKVSERRTYMEWSGSFYDSSLNCKISSKPVHFQMPFFAFFTNPKDYYTALKILHKLDATLVKLTVPITINSVVTTFPINVKFELAKGQYAGQFTEYLKINDIFDIVINLTIEFRDFITDSNVTPVDNMIFTLKELDEEDDSFSQQVIQLNSQATPTYVSGTPGNGATGVNVSSNLTLTFNVGMDETSVQESLTLAPFISADYSWDTDSKTLTINPTSNLSRNTLYTIGIDTTAKAWWNNEPLEEDVEISFRTEV